MVRPRIINRERYVEVDWEDVRSLVINELKAFDFAGEAGAYIKTMAANDPRSGYTQATRLGTAALLRVLKVHPASDTYSIAGTYRQLVNLATVEGVGFPDADGLKYLHRAMRTALVQALGDDEGLGIDPFVSVTGPRSLEGPGAQEVDLDEPHDAPYRRIRLHI